MILSRHDEALSLSFKNSPTDNGDNILAKEYQVGMLWVEGPLSFLEQLCMVSFLDAGQHLRLYTYNDVSNVPDGIEVCDARDVLPTEEFVTHTRTGSVAPHADKFRYRMLAKEPDLIWADTDAYCVKAFSTDNGHFHGWLADDEINNGVLRLPQDSPVLEDLIKHTEDPYSIPPWLPPWLRRQLAKAKEEGNPKHAGEMPWGVWGPRALTWLLKEHDEAKYSLPKHALYPVPYKNRRRMARPERDMSGYLHDDTLSIHFYGRRMRAFLNQEYAGIPDPNCLIGQLLTKHDIDPRDAPIPIKKPVAAQSESDE